MKTARPRLWRMPLLLASSSALGLLAALLGDGIWDGVSWVALGWPVLVMAWFGVASK